MLITESQIRYIIQSKLIKSLLKEQNGTQTLGTAKQTMQPDDAKKIKDTTNTDDGQEAINKKQEDSQKDQQQQTIILKSTEKFKNDVVKMATQVIDKLTIPKKNVWDIFQKSLQKITTSPNQEQTPSDVPTPKEIEDVKKEVVKEVIKIEPKALQPSVDFKCWFRFPQLNGGYFEMAKILMDKNVIEALHQTNRKTKQYEKAGQIYGLLNANGDKATDQQINEITGFFSNNKLCNIYIFLFLSQHVSFINLLMNLPDILTISGKIVEQHKFVGKCLDEFFKNHMMKVGEYYCIDHNVLSFIILKAIVTAQSELKNDEGIKQYATILASYKPKIIKAKFSPDDLKQVSATSSGGETGLDALNQSDDNQKDAAGGYTIKKMFDDRSKDNFEKGDYQQSDKNLARSAREKTYK